MQNVACGRTWLHIYIWANLILNVIKNAGGNYDAIISDGNQINQRFFKLFYAIEPWRTTNNMFLLFYFVRFKKNVWNG